MKKTIISILLGSAMVAQAVVTLNFNSPFQGGVTSNFANSDGVASNGLFWGIIVDNAGDGFLSSYDAITPSLSARSILTSNGESAGDTLVFASTLTANTTAFAEGDFVTVGGDGGISAITALALEDGVDTNDAFAVFWLDDDNNVLAGILEDSTFILPPDGNSTDFDQPFVGVDPIRAANGEALSFGVIPEPSTVLLGGLALFGGLVRRKR